MSPDTGDKAPAQSTLRIELGTDPRGQLVWITNETLELKKRKHPELARNPAATGDAVEDPRLIAAHPDHADREIYVGRDRKATDPALAPARRILIVNCGTSQPGRVVTAYDETSSVLRTSVGSTKWEKK